MAELIGLLDHAPAQIGSLGIICYRTDKQGDSEEVVEDPLALGSGEAETQQTNLQNHRTR